MVFTAIYRESTSTFAEIAVAHFNSAVERSRETIDRLDVGRAADITRKASCARIFRPSRGYSETSSLGTNNKMSPKITNYILLQTATSPTSLVLALIYLERLRAMNKRSAYLDDVSSTELFLATLVKSLF